MSNTSPNVFSLLSIFVIIIYFVGLQSHYCFVFPAHHIYCFLHIVLQHILHRLSCYRFKIFSNKELDLFIKDPPQLYYDNTSATYLCADHVCHSCMKHVTLDYHFVCEQVTPGAPKVHNIFHIQIYIQMFKRLC